MSKVQFGYWKTRGLGHPLRLLLAYTGLEFQDNQYTRDESQKWFKGDKQSLGFDFPNLPYLIDGQTKLTESVAILRYIPVRAGRPELLGKTLQDQAKVENLIGVIGQAMKDIRMSTWNKQYKSLVPAFIQNSREKFNFIRDFVGNKPFALGYLTVIDFLLSEHLYYFETLYPEERVNYQFWWRIRDNFNAFPEIKAYYQRPDAIEETFMPSVAVWQPKPFKVKLAYWDIRGLAQVSRLFLNYLGVEFEDKTYDLTNNRASWDTQDKKTLKLDFPNLPYLTYGDFNMSESAAIPKFIAEKWGRSKHLTGRNIQETSRLESFLLVFAEIAGAVRNMFFNKDHATAKLELLEKYKAKLAQLEKFVGNKDWVLGYITLADFEVAQMSHYIETLWPEQYSTWPFLQRIRENFNKLPETIAYFQKNPELRKNFYPTFAQLKVQLRD